MRKVSIAVLGFAALAGCSKHKDGGAGGGPIKVDGSSTVFPVSQAVAEEFQKAGKGTVTVGESGTGGGFKKFCRGEIEVTGASRPIKKQEADDCTKGGIEFIELPIAYDGLAVVVHPSNTWVQHLTVEELKKIWAPESKITNWKDVREGFPDKQLNLFGAGTDSGTYDYFTQAIVGKEHSSRGDYTANEDDNVLVQGVAGAEGALGFFGYAYYISNKDKLKIVPIDDGKPGNGDGPIAPATDTVMNGTYQPLSRPIFVYASVAALKRPEVDAFVDYYLTNSVKLSAEVGYIALPAKAIELAQTRYKARKTGSLFSGGSKVGVTVEQLLAAEAK
jgi:phosphate transport system substrate-binding protein